MDNKLTTTNKGELALITSETLTTTYAPNKLKQDLALVRTVNDAIETSTPSIGLLCRTVDVKKTQAYIKLWVLDLVTSVNIKRQLTEGQIDEIALYITTDFRNLTLADINLIFKQAKLGHYGEFYESLDVVKILGWCTKYMEERTSAFVRKRDNEHAQTKFSGERRSTMREDNADNFKDLMKYNLEKNDPNKH
jgi:hypothetical protein